MSTHESVEKTTTTHSENLEKPHTHKDPNASNIVGFESSEDTLPKGYFYSRYFIGSFLAVGIGLSSGTGAFGYAAPILGYINEDLGPDAQYVWISYVYNACLAVFLCLVGRLGDIFGRRYIFIGGALLAVIGSIICATANSINVLIGGNVFLGVASATQLSFHFAIGELVPMKYRYIAVGCLYPFTIVSSGFGPAVSYTFVSKYPGVGWRGTYWLLLAMNGTALLCWTLFYFPPTFEQKHEKDINDKVYWIKHFDYVGTFIFAASFVVFLMGFSWGGTVYPWKSAAVICAITLGGIGLIVFVLWEIYAPLKEPLMPMHLFMNMEWTSSVILLGLGAGIYYAFSIVWPTQVAVLYAKPNDPMYTGYLSVIIGCGFIVGQTIAGLLAKQIGHQKWQIRTMFFVGGVFLACAAVVQPDNKAIVIAVIFIGCVFIGWNESVTLTNATILVRDQKDVGVAGGTAGTVRAGICAILTAIYVTIMTNRLSTEVSSQVPAAVLQSGLPDSSIPSFMTALTSGSAEALQAVPGITANIIAAGSTAYKQANADSYRTVYLSTIAFTGVACLLSYWAPDTEKYLNEGVAAKLRGGGMKDDVEMMTKKKDVEVEET